MKRGLALMLGVAIAVGALYALLSMPSRARERAARAEIDADSRAKLERVIERSTGSDAPAGGRR